MPDCFSGLENDVSVAGLCSDSRLLTSGELFFALKTHSPNSLEYARQAANTGAIAIASDNSDIERAELGIPVHIDPYLAKRVSAIAGEFYDHPSRSMDVIGITGTNGKTSCCYWLGWVLNELGVRTGQIGTLGVGVGAGIGASDDSAEAAVQPLRLTGFTTPDAIQTQKLLAECLQSGAEALVMEVSSHGLDQGRVAAVCFQSAIFTNLSQDHLDYHGDMATYLAAKLRLFQMPGLKSAIVNLDDDMSSRIVAVLDPGAEVYTYSLNNSDADLYFSSISIADVGYSVSLNGRWGEAQFSAPVIGEYNLSNLLAVATSLLARGLAIEWVAVQLAQIPPVPGRMQQISVPGVAKVVVDFAHTPDAVASALSSLRPRVAGRLIAVLGCGGDRDSGKRPLMAVAAQLNSDSQIFTSDNPRHESPQQILLDMKAGLNGTDSESVVLIEDRRQAIEAAIAMASEDDLIAVLGKGHENYQDIRGEKQLFNDAQLCRDLLAMRAAG